MDNIAMVQYRRLNLLWAWWERISHITQPFFMILIICYVGWAALNSILGNTLKLSQKAVAEKKSLISEDKPDYIHTTVPLGSCHLLCWVCWTEFYFWDHVIHVPIPDGCSWEKAILWRITDHAVFMPSCFSDEWSFLRQTYLTHWCSHASFLYSCPSMSYGGEMTWVSPPGEKYPGWEIYCYTSKKIA